jgi:hypothetical protein
MFKIGTLSNEFKSIIPPKSFANILLDKFPLFMIYNENYRLNSNTFHKNKYIQIATNKEKYKFHSIKTLYYEDLSYKTHHYYNINIELSFKDKEDYILKENIKYYKNNNTHISNNNNNNNIYNYYISLYKNSKFYSYSSVYPEKYEEKMIPNEIKKIYEKIKST